MAILKYRKSTILLLTLLLVLLETIVFLSILDEKVLYVAATFIFIGELLVINKYRFDLLLYSCFLVFLLSQFRLQIFDIGRWVSLFAVCAASLFAIGTPKFKITPIVVGLGLISSYSLLTSFVSYYPSISLLKGASLLLFVFLLASVIPAVQTLYPHVDVKMYFLRMFFYFAIAIVISNAVFLLFMPARSFLADRFRGWFMNPNGVGALYGMFFIPVLAFEFISSKPGLTKFAILIVLILALIECIASQSRAGLLAGFTSLFILVLLRKKFQARVIIILSVVLISGGIIGSNPSNNLFRRFIYRNEQTLLGSGRLPVWIDTWGRFLEHPILGSGLGVSNTGLAPVDVAFTTAGYTIEKGNSYLGMLEELGIVGSLIFIGALIIPLFIYSWTYINSSDPIDTGTTQVLISIMVAGLVNAMFEAWILSAGSVLCYTYWLFMTLLFASNR